MTFEPRFDGYAARVRASLSKQPLMIVLFGAEVGSIEPGRVEIQLAVRAEMLQPHGNVHAIIASAVADSAAGYAAQTLVAADAEIVTVE